MPIYASFSKASGDWQAARHNLAKARDIAAMAAAFTLPWTTSGEVITCTIFVILALSTTKIDRWRATLVKPAATLPMAIVTILLAGMLWSPLPFGPGGMSHYLKLLLIPLLMASTFTVGNATDIARAFLCGCLIVLALSLVSITWPSGPWTWFKSGGVPFKDNAVQSGCFALCAFGLGVSAAQRWSAGQKAFALASGFLAALFFTDIFLIYVSKTGIIEALALLGLYLIWLSGWRRTILLLPPLLVAAVLALSISPPAKHRVSEILSDIQATDVSQESLSTASRIDFLEQGR